MKRARIALAFLSSFSLALLSGCLGPEDRVLSIQSTGTVQGFVFFDENGDGELDLGDTPLPGVQVGLASIGSIVPVFLATSDSDGLLEIRRVDVASYEVIVDTASVGAGNEVVLTDPQAFTLSPDDTLSILVGVRAIPIPPPPK